MQIEPRLQPAEVAAQPLSRRRFSVQCNNGLSPRMTGADVLKRRTSLFEWITPVDHRPQLSFARCQARACACD